MGKPKQPKQQQPDRTNAGSYMLFEPEDRLTPEDRALPLVTPPPPPQRGGVTPQDVWGVPIKRASGRQGPRVLYMVYMKFEANGALTVRQMQRPFNAGEQVQQAERRLFNDLKAGTYDHQNFEGMAWRTPCQVTFVVDNPDWKFYFRNPERHGPVRFFRRKDNLVTGTKIYGRNFAFFDATQTTVARQNDAFRCNNFVEDENGPLTQGRNVDYCFQIYLEAPFAPGAQKHITILIDPDGQNQGPGGGGGLSPA